MRLCGMVSDREALNAICRENLEAFTCRAFRIIEPGNPFEYNWHISCIAEHLQAVYDGEIKDLIINVSPRTLKSVQVAQIYPAWVMGKDPSHQIIGASYAHSLAERNVMKARQIIESELYKELFPKTKISKDQNQKDYFTTTMNGQYKGTGIGGTITGFGCNTLLVDDALNPKESVSDTIRQGTNDEIRSTLFSRFNDYNKRRFIMIMQRLHDDDPTGNLLKDGGYHLLKLPAKAHKDIEIYLKDRSWSMKEGDYLTPRLDKEALDKLRTDLGEYHFAGQYMQEPVPVGGGELRPEWVQFYNPGGIKPTEMNIVIIMDAAAGDEMNRKKRKLSDWTAIAVIGLGPDNNYYLLDAVRDKLNPTDRINVLFMMHRKWNELSGKPPKVGVEEYGMMSDIHYLNEKKKQDAYNFPIVKLGGRVQKEARIRRLIPDMQNGRWYFPQSLIYCDTEGRKFDLVQEILNGEMATFPRARHDDMLDAISRMYEPDLNMIFPKPKTGMVEKARRAAAASRNEDSWENY